MTINGGREGDMKRWIREPWLALNCKSHHLLMNLMLCFLLAGVSFRLLFCGSHSDPRVLKIDGHGEDGDGISVQVQDFTPIISPSSSIPKPILNFSNDDSTPGTESRCDLFNGSWISDPSEPAYTNASCHFIEAHQNCLLNGRPDTNFLHWRWKPYQCQLVPFDPYRFLNRMRNKSWALVGDSILRNQVQSLLCLLSKAEEPIEEFHSQDFRSRIWHFKNHNLTISLIWSPFLVHAKIFENENGISTSPLQLHLDSLDQSWLATWPSFDYIIISGGQWFLKNAVYYENNTVIGCHNCGEGNDYVELGYEFAYRKTLNLVFKYILDSFEAEREKVVIFRTWTPSHFENGQWFNGGTCKRKIPYKYGEFNGNDLDKIMREIELEEFNNAKRIMEKKEGKNDLKLLDTYELSLMRPDGHAGAFREFRPFERGQSEKVQQDCLHWCVPGVVDTWNHIVMKMLLG